MTRFLIDVYKVDIPPNAIRRDDLSEATEDWRDKIGKKECYQFQLQGNSLPEIAEKLGRGQ